MTGQTTAPEPEASAPAPDPHIRSRAQIARELFGDDYKGPVEETKPEAQTEEPKPVDTQADEEEAPPEEQETAEGDKPEAEEDKETAPEEDTGEIPIATLSELAEHLGTSTEFLNGIKVPITVDGIPTEATIEDMARSYQTGQAAEHRLEKAKAYTQQQGEAWAAKHAEIETQFQVLAELIKYEEANLQRDVKAVDPSLRDTDPAEWAARTQEFNARRSQIDQIKLQTIDNYRRVDEARRREGDNIKAQFLIDQHQVLLEKLPEWKDEKRAETEKAEIASYLVNSGGFTPQELGDLMDHRQVMIARKAMLYDKSRGKVDTAKKKVATVPKIMKSGAPKPAEQRASERLAALKAKMIKTGTVEDATAYRMAKRGVR